MSVNREINALKGELAKEQLRSTELERRLQVAESRLRRATGLLRDQHRATTEIATFLDEAP